MYVIASAERMVYRMAARPTDSVRAVQVVRVEAGKHFCFSIIRQTPVLVKRDDLNSIISVIVRHV